MRETHICWVCRCIKFTSLREVSEEFRNSHFGKLFHEQIEVDWGHEICRLVLWYDQNILNDGIFNKLQIELLYYHQSFHCLMSVQYLGLDRKEEYTNANQVFLRKSRNINKHYTEHDLDYTFHSSVLSFPLWYFRSSLPTQILQFREYLSIR
jgi:hypothetical protein